MSFQAITLLGRLGRDAELRYLGDGTPVINFSMATNRSWRTSGSSEWESEVCWFRVACFGKSFEGRIARLLKGASVLVVGRLTPDKETGTPVIYKEKASYEVRCQTLRIVDSPESASAAPATEVDTNDIPF